MVRQIEVHGEQIILAGNGALVASVSQPGYWHTIRPSNGALACDCKGYQHRGHCRHVDAVKLVIDAAEAKVAEQKAQVKKVEVATVAPVAHTPDTAPLAGPAIDPPLFAPVKKWTRPAPKTFEELFGYSA